MYEIEIEISLLTKSGHIQITIMIDTQQQYIKLNIHGEQGDILSHGLGSRCLEKKNNNKNYIIIYVLLLEPLALRGESKHNS